MCILQRIKTVCPVCRRPKPHYTSQHNPIPHVIPCHQDLAAVNQYCPFPTNFDDITASSVDRCADCEDLFVDGQGRISDMFLVVDEYVLKDNDINSHPSNQVKQEGTSKDAASIRELAQNINVKVKEEQKISKKKSKTQRRAAAAAVAAGASQVKIEDTKDPATESNMTYEGGLTVGDVMAIACERNPELKRMMEAELRKMQENPEMLPRRLKVVSTATESSRGRKLRL